MFRELYREAVEECSMDPGSTTPERLIGYYARSLPHIQARPTEIAVALLGLASATYGPLPREVDIELVVELVGVVEDGTAENGGDTTDAA
jgi:hypothetical protein